MIFVSVGLDDLYNLFKPSRWGYWFTQWKTMVKSCSINLIFNIFKGWGQTFSFVIYGDELLLFMFRGSNLYHNNNPKCFVIETSLKGLKYFAFREFEDKTVEHIISKHIFNTITALVGKAAAAIPWEPSKILQDSSPWHIYTVSHVAI